MCFRLQDGLLSMFARRVILIALLALMPAIAAAAEPPVKVTRLDGTQVIGESISLSADQRDLKIGGEQTVPLEEVRRIAFVRPLNAVSKSDDNAAARAEVRLRDGSVLSAKDVSIEKDVCRFKLLGIGDVKTDLEHVAAIRFAKTTTGLPKWDAELALSDRKQDRLFVVTKDTVSAIDGFLEELQNGTAKFEWMKETRSVPIELLQAVILASSETQSLKPERFSVRLANGSRLSALMLEPQSDAMRIRIRSGLMLDVSLAGIDRIDCSSSRLIYLSALKPESSSTHAIVALPRRWRNDLSASGRPLQSGAETFERGLGTPIGTRLTYRIPSDAKWFVATAAIELSGTTRSNCSYIVKLDGREVAQGLLESTAPAAALRIDCRKGQSIELIAGAGANFDLGASINWCDASFVLSVQ